MAILKTIAFICAGGAVLSAPLEAYRRQLGPIDIPWNSGPAPPTAPGTAIVGGVVPALLGPESSTLSPTDVVETVTSLVNVVATNTAVVTVAPPSPSAFPPTLSLVSANEVMVPATGDASGVDISVIPTVTSALGVIETESPTSAEESIDASFLTSGLAPVETLEPLPDTSLPLPLPPIPPISIEPLPPATTSSSSMEETTTQTVYEPPVTITVSDSPTTIIDTETITVTPTSTRTSSWAAPPQFTDLDSFSITNFADGRSNLQIIQALPANATNTTSSDDSTTDALTDIGDIAGSLTGLLDVLDLSPSDQNTSYLQLYYPMNSTTPSKNPIGGSDFYATPISLTDATNVTLTYSVLFPLGFQFVEGGKLPGLYGGHSGCSGGNNATTCFSTRMMWRTNGAGELYLYAPKNKQTSSLCSTPPKSVCSDPEYGLSIGRGSFYFPPGNWTTIQQTVVLNTPGKQDGGFRLRVNGSLIMDHNDVYYRDAPPQPKPTASSTDAGNHPISSILGGLIPSGGLVPTHGLLPSTGLLPLAAFTQSFDPEPTGMDPQAAPSPTSSSGGGGLLGPIIGGIVPAVNGVLGSIGLRRQILEVNDTSDGLVFYFDESQNATVISLLNSTLPVPVNVPTTPVTPLGPENAPPVVNTTTPSLTTADLDYDEDETDDDDDDSKPVGFQGLFFSTFFGGSTPDYATPVDQYTFFKDFAIQINA